MLIGVIAEELLLPEAGSGWPAASFIDADSFPLATIAVPGFLLQEGPFDEGDAIYAAFITAGQGLFPQLVVDTETIYAATRQAIIPVLAPSLVSATDLFYSPAVLGNVLGPSLVIDDDLFGGVKKLQQGKASINQQIPIDPVLDFDFIFRPIVEQTGGTNYLLSAPFAADDTFFRPNVFRLLSPALVTAADVIYAASRFDLLRPGRVLDTDAVYPGSFGGLGLLPGLPIAADSFFAPTVSGGGDTLAASLFTDSDTFFAPTISAAGVTLAPALFNDADTFFAPTVVAGDATLVPSLVGSDDAFAIPVIAGAAGSQTLTAGLVTDTDAFYAPTVTQAGFDGVLALDGPIMPSTPQPTVILIEG